jgi:hypothetical protein
VVQVGREASQRRDCCVAKNATPRAARPDSSRCKERLFGMTSKLHHYQGLVVVQFEFERLRSHGGPATLAVAVFQEEGRACPERSRRDLARRPATHCEGPRQIPRPASKSAGRRDDASQSKPRSEYGTTESVTNKGTSSWVRLLRCGQPPCFNSVRTCLAISFRVSKTPTP